MKKQNEKFALFYERINDFVLFQFSPLNNIFF